MKETSGVQRKEKHSRQREQHVQGLCDRKERDCSRISVATKQIDSNLKERQKDIHTLLHIKQITNKNLLYSTGNSTQYSVMAYMGKEYLKKKKKSGYMYMYN